MPYTQLDAASGPAVARASPPEVGPATSFQDRSRWDRSALAEAHDLIVDGLRGGRPGRYVLQASIASLYAEAPTYDQTDWRQIVTLYDQLLLVWPCPWWR